MTFRLYNQQSTVLRFIKLPKHGVKDVHLSIIMKPLDTFIQNCMLLFLWTLIWSAVSSEVYESIYWSPLNPKFHFSEDQFEKNLAYYTQVVSPKSQINLICPNVATIPVNLTQYPSWERLYENIWMVGAEEFSSCRINTTRTENHLVHICDRPHSLHYYTIQFIHQNISLYSSHPGKTRSIYFLATSNGTKKSMNHKSGGHCMDRKMGISMRIQFKVCESNSTDSSCYHHPQIVVNKTKIIKTCKNVTTQETGFSQEHFWEILAIILGVLLVVSFIIHSVLIICYCVRKNRKPTRQSSQHSQKGGDEPLKSLIVDSQKKKPKHGHVSAAL